MKLKFLKNLFVALVLLAVPTQVFAAGGGQEGHAAIGNTFLFLTILLLSAKLGGIIEKIKFPGVLGELAAGIVLSGLAWSGFQIIDDIRHDTVISFLAQLGVVILLFEIGLESNIKSIMSVGMSALAVASIGVIIPFLVGYFFLGPVLFPNVGATAHLFIAASMVATSVGITASILKELGLHKTRPYQTVLGAAVIDDILGLVILAIVSAIAAGVELTVTQISLLSLKSFGFLLIAVVLGQLLAPIFSRIFSQIHTGTGMKFSLAILFAFFYAYLAHVFGLEPIIGAFAAGLVLDAVHFSRFDHSAVVTTIEQLNGKSLHLKKELESIAHAAKHTHIEDMTHSLSIIFVPIFFAYTGLQIDFSSLLDPKLYLIAGIVSVVAILTKMVAAFGSKGSLEERMLVGISMVPRGEVGLIFAAVGKSLGAIDGNTFSIIVLMSIFTTFFAAPAIKWAAIRYVETSK